eukprot:g32098.t1
MADDLEADETAGLQESRNLCTLSDELASSIMESNEAPAKETIAPRQPAPSPVSKPKAKPKATFVSTTMAWGCFRSKVNKWSSTAGFKDTLTGEQISRAQAIAEVGKVQKESAMRILEMLSELLMLRPDHFVQKGHLLEKIEIQKSEKKALFDKIAKRNRSFTQDIAGQRQRLRHFSDEHAQVNARILKEAKEASSLQAFGRETQACMLAVFEHKLNSVFSVPLDRKPSEVQAAPTQPTRLENSFLKERVSSLEQQVDLLTQKIATVQRQHAVLIATKEKLEEDLEELRILAEFICDPGVTLPAGVTAGQAAQQLKVTEEQIEQFQEDGVIMIKGAMKEWVEYLQKVTEDQIEKPHLWSLVGRMSGMYDYIQRNMWMTNNGFRDFLYYSPLGHVVSQLGKTEEVRCSTDMLLVNPNHAIRWWVAMDPCGQDGIGAPEYLLGSHRNQSVSSDAVFVSLEEGKTRYTPEPGDLIIWDARTIHRIVAPPGQKWEAPMTSHVRQFRFD